MDSKAHSKVTSAWSQGGFQGSRQLIDPNQASVGEANHKYSMLRDVRETRMNKLISNTNNVEEIATFAVSTYIIPRIGQTCSLYIEKH